MNSLYPRRPDYTGPTSGFFVFASCPSACTWFDSLSEIDMFSWKNPQDIIHIPADVLPDVYAAHEASEAALKNFHEVVEKSLPKIEIFLKSLEEKNDSSKPI